MEETTFSRLADAAAIALADLPVAFAYLFGSQATGRALQDSDVDVAVYLDDLDEGGRIDTAMRCADRLATVSGIADIQVVALNDLPLRVAGRVLRDRLVVLRRRGAPSRLREPHLTDGRRRGALGGAHRPSPPPAAMRTRQDDRPPPVGQLLVHGYTDVDDQRVATFLRSRLQDLDRFRAAMGAEVLHEDR